MDRQAIPPRQEQEVFDAELYALYQAAKIFNERSEPGQEYIILSTAAIERARTDETGPGQRFAISIMEVCSSLSNRGNTPTLRWVPSHLGVEGNETADDRAKGAVESLGDSVPRDYLRETSCARMTRRATKARPVGVGEWIVGRVDRRRRYKPPNGQKVRKELRHECKALVGCYY